MTIKAAGLDAIFAIRWDWSFGNRSAQIMSFILYPFSLQFYSIKQVLSL